MILLNFSHDIDLDELPKIASALGISTEEITEAKKVPAQLRDDQPFDAQVSAMLAGLRWTNRDWETGRYVVIPPGHAAIALVLVAHIHALSGHFPTIIRLRPDRTGQDTKYVFAEAINLDGVRAAARAKKFAE